MTVFSPAIAADRTELKALDPTLYPYAFLTESGRAGFWRYDSSDVSSFVSPRSISSSAVDSTADTITSNGHRLQDGDCVMVAAAANGLSVNTYYYAIRLNGNVLQLAASRTNALSGVAIDLTGTSSVTLKIVPDDLEGTILFKGGDPLDGSGGAWLRIQEEFGKWNALHFGLEVGGSSDNGPILRCVMHVAEEAGGGRVVVPAGYIYMVYGLRGRRQVWLEGEGKQASILDFHGDDAAYAIDCYDNGADGLYPYDRTICGFRDFTVNASNIDSGSDLVGCRLGGNYRSAPILERIKLAQTPGHGILFDYDNWNIDIVDVELDTCGRLRSGASGIYSNPGIASLNHINFTRVRTEGCGNSSSNAGGINITFNSIGPRGFQFTDCQAEGNFGSDEVYLSNATGVYIDGFYVETLNVGSVNRAGIEATNCTGHIHGAQMYADAGKPHQALKFNGTSTFTVMDVDTGSNWASAFIEANDSSVVRYANLSGSASNVANGSSSITAM
jgi:hypothetical protein